MVDVGSDHDFSGHFCVNQSCPMFGKKGEGNIRLKGHGGKRKDIHELICATCSTAFSENYATPFYRRRMSRQKVLEVVEHILAGGGVRGTADLLHIHRDTVLRTLRLVAAHALVVLNHLLRFLDCHEVQMDEFWTFVQKKEKNATTEEKRDGLGDRWVHLAMDAPTRLVVAWVVARRTQKATDELIATLAAKLADPLDVLYTSDQHEPYRIAIERLFKKLLEYRRLDTGPQPEPIPQAESTLRPEPAPQANSALQPDSVVPICITSQPSPAPNTSSSPPQGPAALLQPRPCGREYTRSPGGPLRARWVSPAIRKRPTA